MAKPRGINQKAKWRAHSIRIARYADMVQSVYDTLNQEIAKLALKSGYDGTEPFRFADYPATKRKIDEIRTQFVSDMRSVIYSGTSEEWRQSNLVQDLLADKTLAFYGIRRNGKRARVYYQKNSDALKAFQQRKDKGLNLSQKLWNQSANYKQEMEYALSSAIEKGTSAVKLSKRLSKYLVDFPSLKKDYKEKYGKAVTCQDCEYRSIRLARTEINMAYRMAEQERWKQFDFVLGYEVKLTQNGRHIPDICDDLKGKYPKDFKFTGWHPNCICYVIPVLKTEEQFFNDEDVSEIVDPPENFTKWVDKNRRRIAEAEKNGTLPYFIRDNSEKIKKILNPEQKPLTTLEKAKIRHDAKTPEQVEKIQSDWNRHRLQQFENAIDKGLLPEQVRETLQWMRDSNDLGDFDDFKRRASLLDKAVKRHAARTPEQADAIRKEWDERKTKQFTATALNKEYRGGAVGRDITSSIDVCNMVSEDPYRGTFTNNVARMQGFDAPAKLVTKEEFEALAKEYGDVFYRTVNPTKLKGKDMTSEEFASLLYKADKLEMNGGGPRAYGDGIYVASSTWDGEKIQPLTENAREGAYWGSYCYGNGKHTTLEMTWTSKPNIIKESDLLDMWDKLSPEQQLAFDAPNTYACALGYDGMYCNGVGYLVIWNRSIIAVKRR